MNSLTKSSFFDYDLLNKRAGGAEWYFNLEHITGRLIVMFRRRNVIEIVDAKEFILLPPPEKGNKV